MKDIIDTIRDLKAGDIRKIVDARINEFRELGKKKNEDVFQELCFCILTANFNAERGIKIQGSLGMGFIELPEAGLAGKLKKLGHRYPNTRSRYIVDSRKCSRTINDTLQSLSDDNERREWLVKNVKGLGYKEASHFLRNIGYPDYAIIDFHIIDLLERHDIIKRPKTLSRKKYLKIENVLRGIASELDMNLAELDLYLWYMETGKVLK
jgi:N-glycosylase/DNA lyase